MTKTILKNENLISFKYKSSPQFNYNPKPNDIIKEDMILFFIMDPKNILKLTKAINES